MTLKCQLFACLPDRSGGDESPKQLIKETRAAIEMKPGCDARQDFEYERCGVANIFLASEPLTGKRYVEVTERKTKADWARFIKQIADDWYKDARKITLVMDNLANSCLKCDRIVIKNSYLLAVIFLVFQSLVFSFFSSILQ